uniref:Uncharacterized protein n=1 Tax=Rhizophora mucronata TaxID=61149 RepID=A0A2P2J3K0_RHIMU
MPFFCCILSKQEEDSVPQIQAKWTN